MNNKAQVINHFKAVHPGLPIPLVEELLEVALQNDVENIRSNDYHNFEEYNAKLSLKLRTRLKSVSSTKKRLQM